MKNFTYYVPTKIDFGQWMISHLSELSESGERVPLSEKDVLDIFRACL